MGVHPIASLALCALLCFFFFIVIYPGHYTLYTSDPILKSSIIVPPLYILYTFFGGGGGTGTPRSSGPAGFSVRGWASLLRLGFGEWGGGM